MKPDEQQHQPHQVGITNSQENNPNPVIADLTKQMNSFNEKRKLASAACVAVQITALSKDELYDTFVRHGVEVKHLDHQVIGIFNGEVEPSYDVHVEGNTTEVPKAAKEFGKRHAQERILITRKMREGEESPDQHYGLKITLNVKNMAMDEVLRIAEVVRLCKFDGATFAPKRDGTISIYHTSDSKMTSSEFK